MSYYDDGTVMAAWERLDELLKIRDQQVAEQERLDREWEMGDMKLMQPEKESDA